MSDSWIEEVLRTAQPFRSETSEDQLIEQLLNLIDKANYPPETKRLALSAAFDLLIAAEYYGFVAHTDWLYCSEPFPVLLYPYTNTCPVCLFKNEFHYHKSKKPKSGSIGVATSRLLGVYIKAILKRKGLNIEILRGREPVDAIFIEHTEPLKTVFFTEIKASPLLTMPLVIPTQVITDESEGAFISHRITAFPTLFNQEIQVFIPNKGENGWNAKFYSLGAKLNSEDVNWAYRGFETLLKDEQFFQTYFLFWYESLLSYAQRIASPVYWLTNGSGQPFPRPAKWPRREGTGYESISDAKTSVGMDRTDDIKKATYQVIKLGAEGKPSERFLYKTGIISNIHAARHFDEYLLSLKDMVWTRTNLEIKTVKELDPNTPLFNLFDGIVTLTQTTSRDSWIRKVFDF
jgi:hypothetical protein